MDDLWSSYCNLQKQEHCHENIGKQCKWSVLINEREITSEETRKKIHNKG